MNDQVKTEQSNEPHILPSELNVRLANYPAGYTPSEIELESDAWLENEMKRQMMEEWNAEHTRKWLEEEDATGRMALICGEANWQVGKSEQIAALAITKARANAKLTGSL